MKKAHYQQFSSTVKAALTKYDTIMQDAQTKREKAAMPKYSADYRHKLAIEAIEAEKAARDVLAKCKVQVSQIANDLRREAELSTALKGEDLTPDTPLLTGSYKLNETDLNAIYERNRGNTTMIRLIANYAKEHNLKLPFYYVGASELCENINTMVGVSNIVLKAKLDGIDEHEQQMGESSLLASCATDE